MNNEKMLDLIKKKPFLVPRIILNNYRKLNITEEELIFLICIINLNEQGAYDPNIFVKELNMDKFKVMEIVSNLCDKKIISLELCKNSKGKTEEFLSLDLLYNKLFSLIINEESKIVEDDSIYDIFEKEFGRTLSPMEYEIIKCWVNDNLSKDLIVEALKEATYNGVNNLRYIDKILYEWNKKNLKTKEDVIKDKEKYRNSKKDKVDVFDYNWLDE